MPRLLRSLGRLRGPAGVVALAVAVGTGVGLFVAHAVLAAWTYRDAARRDLRAPGRWALAVLVGGVFGFVPYVVLQRATDWSGDSRALGAARRVADRNPRGAAPEEDTDGAVLGSGAGARAVTDDEDGGSVPDRRHRGDAPGGVSADGRGGRSLAMSTARYGWKAARLGGRGARWAAGRARRVLAD